MLKSHAKLTLVFVITAILSINITAWAFGSAAESPVITPEQIEADWLNQNAIRYNPPAKAGAMAVSQSSAAQQSVDALKASSYNIRKVIQQGLSLAENLRQLGTNVDKELAGLKQIEKTIQDRAENMPEKDQRDLYLQVRSMIRRMALANPLLDFDSILFVKRAPGLYPHMSDQYYGWWSRPGGGIYLMEGFKGGSPKLRCLTKNWPAGNFLQPELSNDGSKILFAYCRYYKHVAEIENKVDKQNLPADAFYHVFEMAIDGSNYRQLTHGRYDDFDARYLPNDDIVFLSTRKGQFIQCDKDSAAATNLATMPDSYVRCGGNNKRPVPVFTLHVIDSNGDNLRAISAFENFEWTPSVSNDGRILYARWDYIDRFNGHFMSLWSTNPDGTNPQLVYGNYTTQLQCVFEARSIPNSGKLIFTASAHHSINGGSLVLFDRKLGIEGLRPLTRLTPEVCFPESEGWSQTYYASPWPLSEDHYLVAWSDRKLPPHVRTADERNPVNALGIYLYDKFGNLELIYRDPNISSMNPIPVRARSKPPIIADTVDWKKEKEGKLLVQDVYQGLQGVERGAIKKLRIIGVPPKTQPHMNRPSIGISEEDPGKFILGTVPVERDGSVYFRVPSGVPVFFQALDSNGLAVQTMRSLTYIQPGQTLSCVGCHESRDMAPLIATRPIALTREPSKLTPGPSGSWPLRFDRLVQPVLDKNCIRCHQPQGIKENAAKFDLTEANAYLSLLNYADKDLHKLAFEKDMSLVGQCPASQSKLLSLLISVQGHQGVKLDRESIERLVTWMDVYAQRQGSFSTSQEEALIEFRRQTAAMLDE